MSQADEISQGAAAAREELDAVVSAKERKRGRSVGGKPGFAAENAIPVLTASGEELILD